MIVWEIAKEYKKIQSFNNNFKKYKTCNILYSIKFE